MADKSNRASASSPKRRRGSILFEHLNPNPNTSNNSSPLILSSPAHLYDVIRKFDERKKDLVRSMGFHGLLQIPRIGELNPKFTLWLMKKIRWNTGALVVGDKINFVIREEHVGKIIGIPYSGLEVREKLFETEEEKLSFKDASLSFLCHGSNILEAAEAYLARDLQFRCTKEGCNRFKVAFIIFVMGTFFAPAIEKDMPRSDFWGALRNPDAIHSFNWSSFVLNNLVEASRLVVWAAVDNIDVSVILGCPLILQVLYLDLIDLGHLKLQHNGTPRVKHFNSYLLSNMIQADYVNLDPKTLLPIYGRAGVLRTDNTCYNLRNSVRKMNAASTAAKSSLCTSVQANPETGMPNMSPATHKQAPNYNPSTPKPPVPQKPVTIDLTTGQTLGINPIPQANNMASLDPLINIQSTDYSSIMKEFFNGQVDNGLLGYFKFHEAMCLGHIAKFSQSLKDAITAENISLIQKVANHHRRSNGLPEIKIDKNSSSALRRRYEDMLSGAESANEADYITPRNSLPRSARCVTDISVEKRGSTSSPRKTMSTDELIHQDRSNSKSNFTTPLNKALENSFDLEMNGSASAPEPDHSFPVAEYPIPKPIVDHGKLAISHWAMNVDHPIREYAVTHSFYEWIASTNSSDLKRPWIISDLPSYINFTRQMLKDFFTDTIPPSPELFDICVRRLRQLDKAICPKGVTLRWRHLFESDFSMNVLGGENPAHRPSIMHQVASHHLDYELCKCRMFFVPAFYNGLWWCYAWDMKSRTVTINDPAVGPENDDIVIKKHAGTIGLLSRFLTSTMNEYYVDWITQFEGCNAVVHRTPEMPIERAHSAFFTLFFIKNFNGRNLTASTHMNALNNFKECMLYEILELKDNCVKPPNSYVQTIDD